MFDCAVVWRRAQCAAVAGGNNPTGIAVAHIVVAFRGHSPPAAQRLFFSSLLSYIVFVCTYVVPTVYNWLGAQKILLLNNDPWEPREDRCFSSIYVLATTFHSPMEIR